MYIKIHMQKISTTSLAKEKKIVPAKLFEELQGSGYIVRKNEWWELTDSWKRVWGETQKSDKYGEYIVWPMDLKIEKDAKKINFSKKLLNATTIGDHFKASSQRLNLILSELGLVEKDVAGWRITKLGKSLGWSEHAHDISWAHYILWPESILTYSRLVEVFNHELNEIWHETENSQEIVKTPKNGFREKFEAKLRTLDWHYVRSKAEVIIDNLLYQYRIVHAYERKLPVEEDVYSDFYIPSWDGVPQSVYIEYWGLENDEKYLARKKQKQEIYKKNELALIELSDEDIQNLDDILPRKLLQFKIKIKG